MDVSKFYFNVEIVNTILIFIVDDNYVMKDVKTPTLKVWWSEWINKIFQPIIMPFPLK